MPWRQLPCERSCLRARRCGEPCERYAKLYDLVGAGVPRQVLSASGALASRSLRRAEITVETSHPRNVSRRSRQSGVRLRRALDAGSGHIAVFGKTPEDAAAFVDFCVANDPHYWVARASVRRPQAAENAVADSPPDRATVIIVHDVEGATASQLEKLRSICEQGVDHAERVRVVLVGAAGLERTLIEPEARALASRVGVRIHLAPGAPFDAFAATPGNTRRWAFVASAFAAAAAILCMAYTDLPVPGSAARFALGLAQRAVAVRDHAVSALGQRSRTDLADRARTVASSAETPPDRATGAGSAAAIPSTVPPSTPTSTMKRVAAHGGSTAGTRKETGKDGALARRPTVRYRFLATVVSLLLPTDIGVRVIDTEGALIESVLMAARLLAGEDGERGVTRPVQLGSFERPQPAFALKSTLVRDFDRVAVARFDRAAGTFYSVRVFDVDADVAASPATSSDEAFAASR